MSSPRNLLAGPRDLSAVRAALVSPEKFRRYPSVTDRGAWERLPAETRRQLVAQGEARIDEPWEHLTASLLLDYKRKGDRRSYQDPHFRRRTRLQDLVMAECAEGQDRFIEAIANNIWLTCEETFWGWPAHLDEQKAGRGLPDAAEPIVDLGVGESAALMAWIDHLLGDQLDTISPLLRQRIRYEVDRRLLTPCLERDDFWWMSWDFRQHTINNWNPWVNSNWLACVFTLETDLDRRAQAVHKIMRSLDLFINHQPEDGGCDEGPGYWDRAGGSLFDCLELLHHATAGRISIFDQPQIQEMGRFIQRAHVAGDWFMNFADAAARTRVDGALVQRYGHMISDKHLVDFGRWVDRQQANLPPRIIRSLNRTLAELFDTPVSVDAIPPAPLLRDMWLPELQVMAARDQGGSATGLYFGAKGGHNAESHNHNDLGSFITYLHGEPLLIDVGVETYTAKTFSPQRYEIWTMQSQWHNLPTVNGTMQMNGREFAAREVRYEANDTAAVFSLDLAGAYPKAAAVKRWHREIRLQRNEALVITDDFELSAAREPIVWNFMCAQRPEIITDGQIRLTTAKGDSAVLTHAAGDYSVEIDTQPITDANMQLAWGDQVYRLRLTANTTVTAARCEFRISIPPTKPTR